MAPEDKPGDDDEHAECRREISRLHRICEQRKVTKEDLIDDKEDQYGAYRRRAEAAEAKLARVEFAFLNGHRPDTFHAGHAAGMKVGMERRNHHELYLSGAAAERERFEKIIYNNEFTGDSGLIVRVDTLLAAIREGKT